MGRSASAPQLYHLEDLAAAPARGAKDDSPDEVHSTAKIQIAVQQLRTHWMNGAEHLCVLADVGYGVGNAFCEALSDTGLLEAMGITSAIVVSSLGRAPLPLKPYSGEGRLSVMPRRTATL